MAGFLEYLMNPATQGMLNLSAGLLQAGGPSRTPVSFGQALGQGVQQGVQGVQNAQQTQLQQQLMQAKMAELQRQANAPLNISPGGVIFDPVTKRPIFQAPFAPKTEAEPKPPTTRKIKVGTDEVSQEWDPIKQEWKEVGRGPAHSDKPLVTIENKQATKFEERMGAELAEQYSGLQRAGMNAPSTIAKYDRLGSLLGQVQTGKFKGATTDLKAAAKGLGIDLTALGVADDVAPAQAARALSNQIALELRNPAGGAGMPGALSDKDREFLIQSIPGLENDPTAVGKMIEYRVKLAQREQEVAKKARAYRKKNGKFDEGFYDELQEWSAKNPLFPESKPGEPKAEASGPTLTAAEAAELEQLRKRFKK
jgi:hypothetical protein